MPPQPPRLRVTCALCDTARWLPAGFTNVNFISLPQRWVCGDAPLSNARVAGDCRRRRREREAGLAGGDLAQFAAEQFAARRRGDEQAAEARRREQDTRPRQAMVNPFDPGFVQRCGLDEDNLGKIDNRGSMSNRRCPTCSAWKYDGETIDCCGSWRSVRDGMPEVQSQHATPDELRRMIDPHFAHYDRAAHTLWRARPVALNMSEYGLTRQ